MTTTITAEASQTSNTAVAAQAAQKPKKDDGFSFSDLLDVINPLQHIPVVSTIYRELTGDKISPAARIAGDGLYGGLIGLGSSIVNEIVEGTTGKDIGEHIWATLFGDDDDDAAKTTVATPDDAASGGISSATAEVPAAAPTAASAAASTGPVTPLNGPTSFFQGMQHPGHGFHGVPLNTTVPVGDANNKMTANEAMLKTQQSLNGQGPTPAPNLGTTGLSSAASPPPSIAPAPPLSTAPIAPANITDLMMSGLDKYKALAQQPGAALSAPAPLIN